MKKGAIILTLLLLLPVISAIQVDMKDEFKQGETLIAKISGNFLEPILKENIYFYRGYQAVPFPLELLRIEQDYFIYTSTLGKSPGNYSLVIKDSEYYIAGGQISDQDIAINFSILEDYADFSATPGVLVVNGSFSLEIQNLKDEQLTIYIDKNATQEQEEEGGFFSFLFGDKDEALTGQTFTLKVGEIKQITLEFEKVSEPTLKTIQLSSENLTTIVFVYVLPVEEPETKRINFEQSFFNVSMSINSNISEILYLMNLGETTFENITLNISESLQEYISIEPEFFKELKGNETKRINLSISSKNKTETIEGIITAKTSDDFYAYVEIIINVLEEYVPEDNVSIEEPPPITKTCEEHGGIICNRTQECEGDIREAQNTDSCCLGECVEKKKSPAGKIIGWVIIIGLVGLFVWFYFKKFKKTRKKVDLLKVAEGKKPEIKRSKRGKFEDEEE